MAERRNILQEIYGAHKEQQGFFGITVGTVVSTNDPMQLGRVRAMCPYLGDRPDMEVGDIPWAMYSSPTFGSTFQGKRGGTTSQGGVGYGMWMIPKVGAQVLVACIDGDTNHRVFLACLVSASTLFSGNTMPHGRYTYAQGEEPSGPLTSEGMPIQPLHSKQTEAFGGRTGNFEWRSRGGDYSVAALDTREISKSDSPLPDDKNVPFSRVDGPTPFIHVQGYAESLIAPEGGSTSTGGKNMDSSMLAFTTAGFHALSMDDRPENQRIRLRTTNGSQIILDDTNERIYINVSNGAAWIQIDEDGTIEFYGNSKINLASKNDINITSDKTIRLFGKEGVHIRADNGECRIFSKDKLQLLTDDEMRLTSKLSLNAVAKQEIRFTSSQKMNLKSGSDMLLSAGPNIHLNGPQATPGDDAEAAFFTNRVPTHEPWQRISTKENTGHETKFPYDSPENGKEDKDRGPNWHR